jgi:DHA2 family multidrug resistance protein
MSIPAKDNIMDKSIPIFRAWVPEWLVQIILFMVMLPGLIVFFLPMANVNAAAGYYGCEPADIQFSVILFYSGYAGFYGLERRFFSFLAAKEYFVIFTFLQILGTFICYHTDSLYVLFPVRFIQGLLFAGSINLSLTLMLTRFRSERAREISFSVLFGLLLCAMPFNNLITAGLVDAYNFNVLYKVAIFFFLPGLFMLLISMNDVRLQVRFPLYNLDWQSFVIYSLMLVLVGYMVVYGQEYYWLEDMRIRYSLISLIGLSVLYIIRQLRSRRPYTDLAVFRYRNFVIGLLLLFIMYICRFASGITNSYFLSVLRLDPIHLSYINVWNIAGVIAGVVAACILILRMVNIRYIWLPGFALLLVFHVAMFYLFDTQADENNFYTPLFVQGVGVGMIMVPTIVYAISSVPIAMGASASALALTTRYLGFCASIGIMNYYELYGRSRHYSAFQDHLTAIDPMMRQTLARQVRGLMARGMDHEHAVRASYRLLTIAVSRQSQMRFAMDYYEIMAWLLVATLLVIALFPYLNRTIVDMRSREVAPA